MAAAGVKRLRSHEVNTEETHWPLSMYAVNESNELNHLGITTDQVVAFGDSENDVEMFRASGAAVAMGQADDATRAAATHVTARNDEAGVAQAVRRILETGTP